MPTLSPSDFQYFRGKGKASRFPAIEPQDSGDATSATHNIPFRLLAEKFGEPHTDSARVELLGFEDQTISKSLEIGDRFPPTWECTSPTSCAIWAQAKRRRELQWM
jgi:hypothetical protein